jgi:hypothetical protein
VKRIAFGLLLPLAALPAAAQEPRPLTDTAAAAVMAFYNDAATTRVGGGTRIAAGTLVEGNLAALGGPLVIAGRVRGDVVVINGDLRLLPGSGIDGSVRVVGGRIEGPTAAVAGAITLYAESLRFRREGDRMVAPDDERIGWPSAGMATPFGRVDFRAGLQGSYNRVEGLPVMLGPRLQFGHSNPTVLDSRLVYRTRSGLRFHHAELGYDTRLEQYLGGRQGLLVGLGLHDRVDPIEHGGLSDTENSLATFILHQDHRDHYARYGWSAYLRFIGTTHPYDARIEYRDEKHRSIDPGTPWSLLRNDSPWRAQPRVAAGALRSLHGSFVWDTRNEAIDPAAGWLVAADVEQGLGGTLAYPPPDAPEGGVIVGPPPGPRPADSEFTFVSVDARRYLRIGPRSRLAVRARAAGAPDSGPLPPQRQLSLGGEGTLPAFPLFEFDCGARATGPTTGAFYPYYGCDRSLLLQAEYRFALLTDTGISRRLGLDFDLFASPELVLFADAGRAWIEARALDGRSDSGPRLLQSDLGAGLRLGPLGFYIAAPLTGTGGRPNFFVRLGPRL